MDSENNIICTAIGVYTVAVVAGSIPWAYAAGIAYAIKERLKNFSLKDDRRKPSLLEKS
jgi:hypothetical protein